MNNAGDCRPCATIRDSNLGRSASWRPVQNTYRGIYETFLSRSTQAVQQQSFPSTEARVVTEAPPSSKRSRPKIPPTLALAVVCEWNLVHSVQSLSSN